MPVKFMYDWTNSFNKDKVTNEKLQRLHKHNVKTLSISKAVQVLFCTEFILAYYPWNQQKLMTLHDLEVQEASTLSNALRGRMPVPILFFFGGGIIGICLGKISRESLGKGVLEKWLPIPEIKGIFSPRDRVFG